LALRLCDLLQNGLESLFELSAVLGTGNEGAEVETDEALVLQRLGHVASDNALGEALDDRGLADTGLADEHGVILGAAAEHLDDATDLLVTTDHWIELAFAGELREVTAVLIERLVD